MPKHKDLQLSELPLNTRFKRKPRTPNVKAIRQKAKVTVAFYDADHYGVTLRRGITIVKKAKMPINGLTVSQAEKTVRAEVLKVRSTKISSTATSASWHRRSAGRASRREAKSIGPASPERTTRQS
jgi:hypothetical protein